MTQFLEIMVPVYVYLPNDPDLMLYYKDSVPKEIPVIEANVSKMLESMEKRLTLLDESGFEWLYCPICLELPKEPVYLPTANGVEHLYEKIKVEEWFNKNIKDDPCGLKEKVSSSQYVSPTPQQILEFVLKSSGFPIEVFIGDYTKLQLEQTSPELSPLLDSPSSAIQHKVQTTNPPQRSRFCLLLHSIFCCSQRAHDSLPDTEQIRNTV